MNKITKRLIGMLLVMALVLAPVIGSAPIAEAATTNVSTKSTTSASGVDIQDGVTLHCWNWSFNNIKANMAAIAEAGYTAIQTSPIQPIKESSVDSYSTVSGKWWVSYQPTDFCINTSSTNHIGTASQFKAMCEEAEKYGIKVIVDVVANHLADNGANKKSSVIADYLENNSAYWHDISKNTQNWYDRYEVTQYCMGGLPDLNTGNSDIQGYVLKFLKECVDAGADGFRFDAAKHIETPDDAYCASQFWPTVINGIKAYKSDVYIYGELLDDTGDGNFGAYTKYMSITDNRWSDKVRENVINSGSAGNYYYSYDNGVSADKLVLWAESHDTYANDNGASKNDSTQNINKTWALVASRADAMSLYLARPSSLSQKLGVASTNTGWDWEEVAAVNKFHNHFAGQGEYISNNSGYVMIERGTTGAVIVNVGSNGTVNIPVNTMGDGTYVDQISGNTFTVSNGKISGNITHQCGYAVIYNACDHSWVAGSTTAATCTTAGSVSYSCSKCGDTKSEVISATGHNYVNGACSVCGTAEPEDRVLYFNNSSSWSKVNVYFWSDTDTTMTTWPGEAMTSLGSGVYTYTVPAEAEYVIFNDGTNKTDDLDIPANYNYYKNGTWTTYSGSSSSCSHSSHNTNGVCTSCGASVSHTYVNNVCSVCGAQKTTELSTDYYLIGYINGANYGCEGDSANLGDYKFVSGKVKATFSVDSYVFVKTGDNTNWYMTDGWLGTDVTSAILYNTNVGIDANKLYVPAGTEFEFTLVENGDGTVTLSYAEPGCEHSYTSKVTTEATCTKAGVKTFTCSECGDSYTESIPTVDHSYKAVVTAPTCSSIGYTTYTCGVCGDNYVADKVDMLDHDWEDGICGTCGEACLHSWSDDVCVDCGITCTHQVVHDADNFTVSCSVCGKSATYTPGYNNSAIKFNTVTLSLADDISVNFHSTVPAEFYDAYVVFTFNGEDMKISDYVLNESNGRLIYTFPGVLPQTMGDEISATLYATIDGMEVAVGTTYSVIRYCNSQLKKTTISSYFRTLISDLLAYGAQAQVYQSYKTDALVTDLVEYEMTPSTFPGLDASFDQQAFDESVDKDDNNRFRTVALQLENKVVVRLGFVIADPANSTVEVTIGGETYTYNVTDLEYNETNGRYYLNFDKVAATQFNEKIAFMLKTNGEQVGQILYYSVNSYVYNKQDAGTVEATLLQMIYNYGKAAEEFGIYG